ncbi:MAG: ATP-binding protein, partial [Pseudomonadota bacterium]|nr:ATP-binding protein [Pseudomonadota bacterium]
RLTAPPPHERVLQASWGSVSNAVEKIVQSEHYSEIRLGHPSLIALIAVLDRMAVSPFPEALNSSDSGLMSWGNWDVRVYVASSYMSLAAFSSSNAESLRDRLIRVLDDPAPSVRLQVVQSLNTLWEVDRDHMWRMAAKVAAEEIDIGVIGFFIGGPLLRLADVAPERCEEFISGILARLPRRQKEESRQGDFYEAIASMASRLWVVGGRNTAHGWILNWVRTLEDSDAYLWPLVSWLRGPLFARYQNDSTDRDGEIQNRAQEVLRAVVDSAGDALGAAKLELMDGSTAEPQRIAAERQYKAGLRLMEHSCNQLYFGSGAFKNGNTGRNGVGLGDEGMMRKFLAEYEDILDRISLSGNAAVAYHLVELYDHLAGASPELVFDKVAALVVGPAASDGYHYESLALDSVVSLVRRYLADYRAAFDDASRRARLVSVLELFSSAGWPEALKLLYELPDLLR